MPRTPAPPRRTVRAVCPHTALRSPSAAGMHGQHARLARRASRHRGHSEDHGVRASRQSPSGHPFSGAVKVRPLPSAEVLLSSTCKRYYEPLRLPARPRTTSAWPYTPQLGARHPPTRLSHGAPWDCPRMPSLLPRRARCVPAVGLDPATPAFPQRPRGRRPRLCNEATPGFATRYGLRGCPLPSGSGRQGTQRFGLPLAPPSSYLGGLPSPRAGLPPASHTVSTAYGRCGFSDFVSPPPEAERRVAIPSVQQSNLNSSRFLPSVNR